MATIKDTTIRYATPDGKRAFCVLPSMTTRRRVRLFDVEVQELITNVWTKQQYYIPGNAIGRDFGIRRARWIASELARTSA